MSIEATLNVTEIQRFCMHDGPGLRTTVFLKGCPLRCEWCHNPETQKFRSELLFYPTKCMGCGACQAVCPAGAHSLDKTHEIDRTLCRGCFACVENCPTSALAPSGTRMTVEEILSHIQKDRAFYGERGGVTVSGGEPFMHGNATVELLRACKEQGISTAVETCGFADKMILCDALPFVDIFLWDIKDTNDARHERHTGVSNKTIIDNLMTANQANALIRLRCILVNGVNTDEEHYRAVAELALSINRLDGVEIIPYHAYGGSKATFIGKPDNGRTEWIPDAYQIDEAKKLISDFGVKVI